MDGHQNIKISQILTSSPWPSHYTELANLAYVRIWGQQRNKDKEKFVLKMKESIMWRSTFLCVLRLIRSNGGLQRSYCRFQLRQGHIKWWVTFPIVSYDDTVTLVTSQLRVKRGNWNPYYMDCCFTKGKSQHSYCTSHSPRLFKSVFRDGLSLSDTIRTIKSKTMKWAKQGFHKSNKNFGQKFLDVQTSSRWKNTTIRMLLREFKWPRIQFRWRLLCKRSRNLKLHKLSSWAAER